MSKIKKIPKFKSEDEEREFWAKNDLTDYFDMDKPLSNVVFPNLKPTTKSISLRLPMSMLEDLKMMANRRDVPYQSFIKIILDEKIRKEMRVR